MHLIRKVRHKPLFIWLLILSLGLRSLIAPGFMLDTRGDGPLGLGITFCGGLNGINTIAGLDDPHSMHHDSDGDSDSHDMHDGLFGAGCGLWSASATYVEVLSPGIDELVQISSEDFYPGYTSSFPRSLALLRQQPRAPPVSRLS